LNIESTHHSTFTTPYHAGACLDSIPTENLSPMHRDELHLRYQSLIGSLDWLSTATRPDLSTVVSLLAQHQSNLPMAIWTLPYMLLDIWPTQRLWEYIF
jgi:hypothetical protein